MFVLHHLIGAAVESASQWKKSEVFMKNVVKRILLFGASVFESVTVDACFTDKHAFNERVDVGKEVYREGKYKSNKNSIILVIPLKAFESKKSSCIRCIGADSSTCLYVNL